MFTVSYDPTGNILETASGDQKTPMEPFITVDSLPLNVFETHRVRVESDLALVPKA